VLLIGRVREMRAILNEYGRCVWAVKMIVIKLKKKGFIAW
jgi:hypothetical protein